ncbi:hypothetical protein LEN26_008957 [Aphanomyces euteiches]|nr:hypothetical protein LEN26_008957 [Aphanomyces euteiches]
MSTKRTKRFDPMPSSLHSDIVIKLVFFLPDWSTVVNFLKAFRPTNMLGPLEHLWEPAFARLEARRSMDSVGCDKYFPEASIDGYTNVKWCREYINRATAIHYIRFCDCKPSVDSTILKPWTPFRLLSLRMSIFTPDIDPVVFSYLGTLVDLKWTVSTLEQASDVLKFAASSSALLGLHITCPSNWDSFHISTSVANDLLEWIVSRQIQSLRLTYVKWETPSLRNNVLTTALGQSSLETFGIAEFDRSKLSFYESYWKSGESLSTTFYCHRKTVSNFVDELEGGFISCFQALIQTKIKRWSLQMDEVVGFSTEWKTVVPFFQTSRVEVFQLQAGMLDLEDIAEMVHGIEAHPTLRELIVYGLLPWRNILSKLFLQQCEG